jgi:hypothetical protein
MSPPVLPPRWNAHLATRIRQFTTFLSTQVRATQTSARLVDD